MKKTIYTLTTIILCLQLSFLAHALVESWYIEMSLAKDKPLSNMNFLGGGYCVLPNWLSYGLLLLAIVGGYFLAQKWWQIVYVEKRHWRFKK